MSNYEIYIVELLELDDVETKAETIIQHIDTAFCQDKITYQQREEYKGYLSLRIKQAQDERKRWSDERMKMILERQQELRARKEYRESCTALFVVKSAKNLR